MPAERTPAAALEAAAAADLVLGDWTGDAAGHGGAGRCGAAPGLRPAAERGRRRDRCRRLHRGGRPGRERRRRERGQRRGVVRWGDVRRAAVACRTATARCAPAAGRSSSSRSAAAVSSPGGGSGSSGWAGSDGSAPTRYAALGCDVAHWSRTAARARRRGRSAVAGARRPAASLRRAGRRGRAGRRETRGLLGAEQLALLPPGAFVINAARGGIVDEAALLAAIAVGCARRRRARRLRRPSRCPTSSPLRDEDRLLLSPHAAGATREAQGRLIEGVVDNIRRAVTGEPVHRRRERARPSHPAPGSMISTCRRRCGVSNRGIGAVAGPWITAPSASRNVESCHGHTTHP